jgi:hypothetical protein
VHTIARRPEWVSSGHGAIKLLSALPPKADIPVYSITHSAFAADVLLAHFVCAISCRVRSCLIDGEAIVTDDKGLAVFELVRRQRHGSAAVLCAFDLIELNGADLRRAPIEHRKHKLARLVRTPHPGIVLNEHYDGDGEIVFKYACKLGCEGIVSKRLGSPYLFISRLERPRPDRSSCA